MANEHDPLCSNKPGYFDGSIDWYAKCECALIAKFRADEREKAAQRVSLMFYLGPGVWVTEETSFDSMAASAIAAARGEAS